MRVRGHRRPAAIGPVRLDQQWTGDWWESCCHPTNTLTARLFAGLEAFGNSSSSSRQLLEAQAAVAGLKLHGGLGVARSKQQHQHQVPGISSGCSTDRGKVSRIDCWVNDRGVITGLRLTDDYSESQHVICKVPPEGQEPSGGGELWELESVVEIRACK